MTKITCDICMDLLPLIKDGIASEDSKQAVLQHIQDCETCKALYNEINPPTQTNLNQAFHKLQQQIRLFTILLLILGLFFGVSLSNGANLFYNTLIMPAIGILGYLLFKWKSLTLIPIFIFITQLMTTTYNVLLGKEHWHLFSLLMWTFIYALFALMGIIIASLIKFAFKKEEQ